MEAGEGRRARSAEGRVRAAPHCSGLVTLLCTARKRTSLTTASSHTNLLPFKKTEKKPRLSTSRHEVPFLRCLDLLFCHRCSFPKPLQRLDLLSRVGW